MIRNLIICLVLLVSACGQEAPGAVRTGGAKAPSVDPTKVDADEASAVTEQALPGSVDAPVVIDGPRRWDGRLRLEVDAGAPEPSSLGVVWNTYYIVADEAHFKGARNTPLYDEACKPITKVRRGFYNNLCIQGSGMLVDKTIVNFGKSCTRTCPAAPLCKLHPVRICYRVLDPKIYPWGMGKDPRPLVPDWSIAVDPSFVPLDTVIYLEELDGVTPPSKSEPLDGCFGAVDTGGGIKSNHVDIFVGTRKRWLAWEKIFPSRSRFKAWINHPRCYRHTLRPDGDVSYPRPPRN